MTLDLSIIVPAFNEEKRIASTLLELIELFEPIYGTKYEIIVITDGCSDNTCDVIRSFDKNVVRHFNYKKRLGKGGAIARGFEKSSGKIICYTDADGSTKPKQLLDLIKILEIIGCDGVLASRYAAGGNVRRSQPFKRRVASRAFNLMIRSLFRLPYRDTQCGAKVFTKKVAKSIFSNLTVTDWAFDVNILYNAHKKGYDVREIAIFWDDEKGSKLRLYKVIPKMFLSIIRLRIIESPFRIIVTNKLSKGIGNSIKKRIG